MIFFKNKNIHVDQNKNKEFFNSSEANKHRRDFIFSTQPQYYADDTSTKKIVIDVEFKEIE